MTCELCEGTGSLITFPSKRIDFWTCPCCNGSGVRIVYGPALLKTGIKTKGLSKKASK